MTDQPGVTGDSNGASAGAALQKAALRNRVRTITGGAVELAGGSAEGADDNPSGTAVGTGVGAVVDGRAYCQTADSRGLGGLLRWARSKGADALTIIAEADVAGDIARRAEPFDYDITVWSADGTHVEPATITPVSSPPEIPQSHRRFAAVITETGARAIDDYAMMVAEVAGLEVARVVDSETGDGPELAVGVGQADRELQQYIHGHLDDDANLRRAIAAVVRHRRPGSAVHPLTRVARQRWLRSVLLDDPSLVGLSQLEPLTPLRARETVLGDEPSAAMGDGTIVVCSVGVDLDLLPEALDYRRRENPEADLIVVLPERDRRLAIGGLAALVERLQVTSIEAPWDRPS